MGFFKTRRPILAAKTELTGGSGGLLNNLVAIVTPVVTDDSDDGYAAGSMWFDTVTGATYMCVDATVGVAVWRLLNPGVLGVRLRSVSTIVANTGLTSIDWNATPVEEVGEWYNNATNTAEVVVPAGVSRVTASGTIVIPITTAAEKVAAHITNNGGTQGLIQYPGALNQFPTANVAAQFAVSEGDIILLRAVQNSSGSVTVAANTTFFSVNAIG